MDEISVNQEQPEEVEGYEHQGGHRTSISTTASDIPEGERSHPSGTETFALTEKEKEAIPKGVYFHPTNQEWRASIQKGEGRIQKTFSVNKYGFRGAQSMALEAAGYEAPVIREKTVKHEKKKSQSVDNYRAEFRGAKKTPGRRRIGSAFKQERINISNPSHSELPEESNETVITPVQRGSVLDMNVKGILSRLSLDEISTLAGMAVNLSLSSDYSILTSDAQCLFVKVCEELIDEYDNRNLQ